MKQTFERAANDNFVLPILPDHIDDIVQRYSLNRRYAWEQANDPADLQVKTQFRAASCILIRSGLIPLSCPTQVKHVPYRTHDTMNWQTNIAPRSSARDARHSIYLHPFGFSYEEIGDFSKALYMIDHAENQALSPYAGTFQSKESDIPDFDPGMIPRQVRRNVLPLYKQLVIKSGERLLNYASYQDGSFHTCARDDLETMLDYTKTQVGNPKISLASSQPYLR